MSQSKPKKRNLAARKPRSRHQKIWCTECGVEVSAPSYKGHLELYHHKVAR